MYIFLLTRNATKKDLINKFGACKFMCMDYLQSLENLMVIESYKNSVNIRILKEDDDIFSFGAYVVIQP